MLKLQSINLDYIRSFVVFGQSRDFKETAKKLNCDASLISRHIHSLESEFGYKLVNIDRKNGSTLTKDGQELFEVFEQAYNMMLLGEKKFIQSKEPNSGKISIGISNVVDDEILNENVSEFNKKYPNVFFKIVNKETNSLYHDLANVSLDFVIDEFRDNDSKIVNFKTEELYSEEYCLLYSKRFFNKEINTLNDLNDLLFILPNDNKEERILFNKLIKDNNININVSMEFDNYRNAMYHVNNGNKVILVPKRLKDKYQDLNSFDLDLNKKIVVSYIEENLSPTTKEFLEDFKKLLNIKY